MVYPPTELEFKKGALRGFSPRGKVRALGIDADVDHIGMILGSSEDMFWALYLVAIVTFREIKDETANRGLDLGCPCVRESEACETL